ncbi:restriction endonuclease subunit S [Pseudarthrobacter sp. MDT3-1]
MSEWPIVRLGDVADEVTVGHVGPMAMHYQESGVPFLRSQNVIQHTVALNDVKYISPEFHATLSKSRLRPGDVITVRTGKPGTTSVVPEFLNDANCSDLVITRPGSSLNARWLSYYMNSAGSHFINSQLVGAVQQHFNVGSAKSMTFSLPSLAEQGAIAEVLGALDDKIAANTKLAATAGELAGLVFDLAATNLDIQPMSEVLSPVLGGTPQRSRAEFWGGNQLWASAKDITGAEFGVITDTDEKITQMAVSTTKTKPLPSGSVILTARGTVGAVARLATPSSFNQSCYGFVPGQVPPGVLYFAVLRATQRAKEIAHGSVFDTITMKTFDHLPFPKFDDDALSATEGRIGPLLDAVAGSVIENAKLAATRDALLPQLMSGKLRVKDAETVLEEAGV